MRLPGWLRGRSRGETADGPGPVRPPESAPAAATPDPPDPGWHAVPAIQRTVADSATDVAHLGSFGHSLASHQDPRFLEHLGHHVTPEAPAGRVDGLAMPRAATLPAPPRPAAPLVQRMTFGGPPPAEETGPTAARPVEIDRGPTNVSPTPVAGTDRPGPPVAETPLVQRAAVAESEAAAGGASRGGESVPTRPSTSTREPVAPTPEPVAPSSTPGGAGLLGDEPLAVGPGLDVGTPVQRTTAATPATHPVPSTSGEPRPPVTVSRLVQPSSTTGTMPAPPVRPVPAVSDDRPPTASEWPSDAVLASVTSEVAAAPAVSAGRTTEAEGPPAAPGPTTGPGATVGLVGDPDHLLDAAEPPSDVSPSAVSPSAVSPSTLPESVPVGQETAPAVQRLGVQRLAVQRLAVQRLAEPTPRTEPPAPALHWPPASQPEHASVAVLPLPPLVPSVDPSGSEGGEAERSARADVGYGVRTDAVPRVQRAVFLPPDVSRTGVPATAGQSSPAFATPVIASASPPRTPVEAAGMAVTAEATMPPARVTAASTPALQRSVAPPRPVAAPRLTHAPVPLTPLPSPHRGVLPPPATPLAPVVSHAPFGSGSSPGAAPLALQREAGASASPLISDSLQGPVAGPTETLRPSGAPRTGWTEVVLPAPSRSVPTEPPRRPVVATAAVQRQRDDEPEPSPVAEAPAGSEPEAPAAPTAAGAVAAAAASPASSSGAATSGAKAAELDELARRLYEPLTARLRAELWLDRERTGRSMTR